MHNMEGFLFNLYDVHLPEGLNKVIWSEIFKVYSSQFSTDLIFLVWYDVV